MVLVYKTAEEDGYLDYNSSPKEVCSTNRDMSFVESGLMWILPRIIVNKYVKCVLVFGLGVGVGLAIISVYNIPRQELYSIYYEDGSSIGQFYDARRRDYPFSVTLQVILDKQLDYSDVTVYTTINQFVAEMEATGLFAEFQVRTSQTGLEPFQ